jgi:hypothetical protein
MRSHTLHLCNLYRGTAVWLRRPCGRGGLLNLLASRCSASPILTVTMAADEYEANRGT